MEGIDERKLIRILQNHVLEVKQAIDDLHGSTDLRDVATHLISTLHRTLTLVSRMDAEEIEDQI